MGRGSRGVGASTELCNRVVLDANCVRGAPASELAIIRAKGFSLHASIEGLREVWGRSNREDNYELLANRIRTLAPHLNESQPIAFVGQALLSAVGRVPDLIAANSKSFRERVTTAWLRIASSGLARDEWRRVGDELDAELEREERAWEAMIEASISIDKFRLSGEAAGEPPYPRGRAAGIIRSTLARRANAITSPPLERRDELHLRYIANRCVEARARRPSPNDLHDGRHLQHVAWPAFLVTTDFGLLYAADATRSPHAAWVRTPVELAEDRIPRCSPWDYSRSRSAPPSARNLDDLKVRQAEFRKRLGPRTRSAQPRP
jgi:hypothetical protein